MLRKRTLGNKKKSTYTVYSNCNGGSVYFNNNLSDVDHIDENKNNNSVENLRWLSHKENSSRSNTGKTKDNSLGKNPRAKKVYDNKGNEYSCLKELSNLLNINYSTLKSRFRKSNKLEINNTIYSYDKTIFEKEIQG